MWAIALWDGRSRTLIASRDRFGVKPLYYTVVDGAWLFASKIKALLAYPGALRGFDEQRVLAFLANCPIDHDERTIRWAWLTSPFSRTANHQPWFRGSVVPAMAVLGANDPLLQRVLK